MSKTKTELWDAFIKQKKEIERKLDQGKNPGGPFWNLETSDNAKWVYKLKTNIK